MHTTTHNMPTRKVASSYSQVQHNGLHGIHEIRRGSGRETDEVEEVHRPPGAAGDALHERLRFALADLMLERALHGRLDVPPSDVALPLGHELESLDVVRHVPDGQVEGVDRRVHPHLRGVLGVHLDERGDDAFAVLVSAEIVLVVVLLRAHTDRRLEARGALHVDDGLLVVRLAEVLAAPAALLVGSPRGAARPVLLRSQAHTLRAPSNLGREAAEEVRLRRDRLSLTRARRLLGESRLGTNRPGMRRVRRPLRAP